MSNCRNRLSRRGHIKSTGWAVRQNDAIDISLLTCKTACVQWKEQIIKQCQDMIEVKACACGEEIGKHMETL